MCDEAPPRQAYCWGQNDSGQVGPSGANPQRTPVAVPGLTNCIRITGGAGHTCAVRGDTTTVWCWGRNSDGQAGQPASTTPILTPRQVPNLDGVVDVQAGDRSTCAQQTGNRIFCWGDNTRGQLGDGTLTSRGAPTRVQNIPGGVTELAVGRFFACVRFNGRVSCWGENTGSMSGLGPNPIATPTMIVGIDDAEQLRAGHEHACVLRGTGIVSCWGKNQYGQLGNGNELDSPAPADVLGFVNGTAIASGAVHTCARTLAGISCWGENINGQLGNAGQILSSRPVSVIGF
ncbi:MAG: hypothetical protein H7X95_01340 [Deltaproteobacteria bacterium]|nr:hypothetical protein [Deltaproteobacteria bacterium]